MLSWVWVVLVVLATLAATTDAQLTLTSYSSYVCITDNIGRQCHTEVHGHAPPALSLFSFVLTFNSSRRPIVGRPLRFFSIPIEEVQCAANAMANAGPAGLGRGLLGEAGERPLSLVSESLALCLARIHPLVLHSPPQVHCQVDGNGCVNDASRNRYMRRSGFSYPSDQQRCTIRVNSAGKLSAVGSFSTAGGAYLTVGGQRYTGSTGGPSDVYVSAGSSFSWRGVDSSYDNGPRWTVCWSNAVPTAAPSAVPTAPTSAPSMGPTAPSAAPSRPPTLSPSAFPTTPSAAPSPSPTRSPTSPTPSPTPSPTWHPGLPQKFQCDTDTDPRYLHISTGPAWDDVRQL